MGKLKLNIQPIYLLFIFISAYFGWLKEFIIYSFVLLIHEYAHFFVARMLGYNLDKITFSFYGAEIKGKNHFLKSHEILIALAGPITNLVLCIVVIASWWVFPLLYGYTVFFVSVNLYIAIFNLLPVFPLDAGRILLNALKSKGKIMRAYKIMKIISYVCVVGFAGMFLRSAFYQINLNYFFVSMFIFLSISDYKGEMYNDFISFTKKSGIVEVKTFIVQEDNYHKLATKLNAKYFCQFILVDKNGKVIKRLNENELLGNQR